MEGKGERNNVAQQGWWKEKERETNWPSGVIRRKSTEKQCGTTGSVEGKWKRNNLAQQGE